MFRSSVSGGQEQSSKSSKKRGVGTDTHSAPRQSRKFDAQGKFQSPGCSNTKIKGLYAPCFISVSTRKIAGFPRCCRKLTAKCVCPPCSCTRGWRCCARCAVCTWRSFAGLVSGTRSQLTLCFLRSTRSCSHQRQSFCRGPLTDDLREYAKTVAHQRTDSY